MSLRESLAVNAAPVFLRLALGVTFFWIGMGKVFHWTEISGQDAAILANYGVIQPSQFPAMEPIAFHFKAASQDELDPEQDTPPPSGPPAGDPQDIGQMERPSDVGRYSASDFPNQVKVRSLYKITVTLHNAMQPGVHHETKDPTFPLWIDFDSTQSYDKWPVHSAWAVGLTELIGGGLILLGLLTRLSALGIAGTMAGAIWLTTIGPHMQTGQAVAGFLPPHDAFDIQAWMGAYWQFALLMCSLALFCTGSGTLSIDRLLFGNPFFYRAPAPVRKKEE